MAKLPFFTRYERPDVFPVPTGDRYDNEYQVKTNERGHKSLVCTGKTDRYAKIQEFKDECNIENILARCTTDPSILNQRPGSYFDATQLPKSLAEFQQVYVDLVNEFNSLPLDTRKSFNNSVEQYVAEYGSEEFAKKLGLVKDALEVSNVSDEKEVNVNAEQ